MKVCRKCKIKLDDKYSFCPSCGGKLEHVEEHDMHSDKHEVRPDRHTEDMAESEDADETENRDRNIDENEDERRSPYDLPKEYDSEDEEDGDDDEGDSRKSPVKYIIVGALIVILSITVYSMLTRNNDRTAQNSNVATESQQKEQPEYLKEITDNADRTMSKFDEMMNSLDNLKNKKDEDDIEAMTNDVNMKADEVMGLYKNFKEDYDSKSQQIDKDGYTKELGLLRKSIDDLNKELAKLKEILGNGDYDSIKNYENRLDNSSQKVRDKLNDVKNLGNSQ